MTDMVKYVCGFFYSRGRLLLVHKKVPEWQFGLLNGIGGKVDPNETPPVAMEREFREETGITVQAENWRAFFTEFGPGYIVNFFDFRAGGGVDLVNMVNDVGEVMSWVNPDDVPKLRAVGNLKWLVPMSCDWRPSLRGSVTSSEHIKERASW
jgi:8-oxo-dGTP diphosphatase